MKNEIIPIMIASEKSYKSAIINGSALLIGEEQQKGCIRYIVRINKSVGNGDICWELDIIDNQRKFYFVKFNAETEICSPTSQEIFFDYLRTNYPDDLEFLLFHPEIFSGKYLK